jgi:purine nucleosidase
MGGALDGGQAEWNFACDTTAAEIVLQSEIPIVLTDLRICQRTRFEPPHLAPIEAGRSPLAPALGDEIHAYWKSLDHEWNIPHDPIALLPLLAPDAVRVEPRRVHFDPTTGVTEIAADGAHLIDVVVDLDPQETVDEIVRRLVVATA